MTRPLSDDELWRRLKTLKKGTFGAFMDMCQVDKGLGKALRSKNPRNALSAPVRERLSKGFEMIDQGRVKFSRDKDTHPGLQGTHRMVARLIERKPEIATGGPMLYPALLMKQITGATDGRHTNLAMPSMPARVRRGY